MAPELPALEVLCARVFRYPATVLEAVPMRPINTISILIDQIPASHTITAYVNET